MSKRLFFAALCSALLASCANPFSKSGPQPAELERIADARPVKEIGRAHV